MYHDLMFDEKERTTPMKAEEFNDRPDEMGNSYEVQCGTRNKAVKYQKDLVKSAMDLECSQDGRIRDHGPYDRD